MKEGTRYAANFKRAYNKLRQAARAPRIPEPVDPIRGLATAVLGVECGDKVASRAIDRAFDSMLDWNELRVSSVNEVEKAMGSAIPQVRARCELLLSALAAIFQREDRMSLERLSGLGRREAKHYLESLDGVDDYAVASVMLWSLGAHAIPVNDPLLEALRDAELVHPAANRGEVQAFLERHVPAAKAKETCLILQSLCRPKRAGAKVSKAAKASRSTKRKRVAK